LSSQVTFTCDEALLSCKQLNICLLIGSSKGISDFSLLALIDFVLPIKLSLSQSMSFCTFTLLFLFRIPLWGRE